MSLPRPAPLLRDLLVIEPVPYLRSLDGLPSTALGSDRGELPGWRMTNDAGDFRGFGDVALRLFGFQLHNVEVRLYEHQVLIVVTSEVPDRDSAAPLTITFRQNWPRQFWEASVENRAEAIRQTLRRWLMHELDENLYIDGKRRFDPHSR